MGRKGNYMFTLTDILQDLNRGCMVHNLNEDKFTYRIVYFVNGECNRRKYYKDTTYRNLRYSLEHIVKENLGVENTVVLAAITTRKDGKTVQLLNRTYKFDLKEYFCWIIGEKRKKYKNCNNYGSVIYERQVVTWG